MWCRRISLVVVVSMAAAAFFVNAHPVESENSPDLDYKMPLIEIVSRPIDGGIREEVPQAHKAKFAKWKAELLRTEFGRRQWNRWADSRTVRLTIRVVEDRGKGAGTDRFAWDEDGEFAGATITLGTELSSGLPTPVYYPVLNALSEDPEANVDPTLIAAAKLSHELGHVEQASKADMKLMLLQSKLVPEYVAIFLKNGLNSRDERLLDLERQMGGTPTRIWEEREYNSEVDAMQFVAERMSDDPGVCRFAKRLKQNLAEYAATYKARFEPFARLLSNCTG
jgi:hypothetical protein